jgi:transposase InsO family protein
MDSLIPVTVVAKRLGIPKSTYYDWLNKESKGQLKDNYKAPLNPDSPLPEEIDAVISYALENPTDGYRRLSYMMIDEDIACFSPSTVYRILSERDLLYRYKRSTKSKGQYDFSPTAPHQQWHTDLMYLKVQGSWYFFIAILDAYSRYIVHWELLENADASSVKAVVETALIRNPGVKPRIVTDNGVQFTSKEYKSLINEFSLIDIKIRINHPESNGAIERFHRTLREEGLAEKELKNKYTAEDIIKLWVTYYNHKRLHAGLKYLRPNDYLTGKVEERLTERKEKIKKAQDNRRKKNREKQNKNNFKEQNVVALPPHPQDLSLLAIPA